MANLPKQQRWQATPPPVVPSQGGVMLLLVTGWSSKPVVLILRGAGEAGPADCPRSACWVQSFFQEYVQGVRSNLLLCQSFSCSCRVAWEVWISRASRLSIWAWVAALPKLDIALWVWLKALWSGFMRRPLDLSVAKIYERNVDSQGHLFINSFPGWGRFPSSVSLPDELSPCLVFLHFSWVELFSWLIPLHILECFSWSYCIYQSFLFLSVRGVYTTCF